MDGAMRSVPELSLVIPCHDEEDNIEKIYAAILESIPPACSFEMIFIDDGSTDRSLERLKKLHLADARVGYRSMLTNYGHQQALLAGLASAKGKFVLTLDGDLQHPPKYISAFLELQAASGADVVSARRHGKQNGFLKNLFSRGYYLTASLLADKPATPGVSDFRLFTRRAVNLICSLNERYPFIRGMVKELRLREAVLDYEPASREQGTPSYTFWKSLSLAVQTLLRQTHRPVSAGLFLGAVGILLSLGQAVHYFVLRVFTNQLVPGQADVMVLLGVSSGFILILLALVLHHLSLIVEHLHNWPTYVVKEEEPSSSD